MQHNLIHFSSYLLLAYYLGSLSCAILLCKVCRLPDPRTQGSNNPGATNVLRIAGKKMAAMVLVGDVLKGTFAVLIGKWAGYENSYLAYIALAAFLGHLFPVFFKFKGGKGVATAIGAIAALSPLMGGILIVSWALTTYLFRYSSLSSIISATLAPVLCLFVNAEYLLPLSIMTFLLILRHKENIGRLIKGMESRVGSTRRA